MRKRVSLLLVAPLLGVCVAGPIWAAEEKKEMPGQEIAFDNRKGNCLACHAMPGTKGEMAGSVAPPLIAMKLRYPDRNKLHAQIWDATAINAKTSMPPFGKHRILTEDEIEKVVDFVHTL